VGNKEPYIGVLKIVQNKPEGINNMADNKCEPIKADYIEKPHQSLSKFWFFNIWQPIICFPVKLARWIMKRSFAKDPSFRYSYQANIAMLIYDDQIKWKESYNLEHYAPPLDLTTYEGRNEMADRIIKLVFE
jgi:hypothetical protein